MSHSLGMAPVWEDGLLIGFFFFPAVIQASDVGKEICFSLDIGRKTVEVTLG